MTTVVAVLAGGLLGLGIALVARELVPSRPRLSDLRHTLETEPAPASSPTDQPQPAGGVAGVVGRWLVDQAEAAGIRLPRDDLRLIGRSSETHLLRKLGLAAAGLVLPPTFAAGLILAGIAIPFALPGLVSLALAVVFFLAPDVEVRRQAKQARIEFRRAISAYINLVALWRLADAGAVQALQRAAESAQGWTMVRIRDALVRAQMAGRPPWEGLSDLADDVGLTELGDLGDIMGASGEDGAAVYRTLRARATALRTAVLADQQAEANAASERLIVPVALLGMPLMVMLMFPAISRLLGS